MKRLKDILPYLGIVLGLAILAYYPVTEAVDAYRRSQVSLDVATAVTSADDEDVEYLLTQAEAYNAVLAGLEPEIDADEILDYDLQLSLTGTNSSFATLVIPCISLEMPIYHGTDDAVLSAGAGHVEGTSLPVGGASTHCMICGHSGLQGMSAFDNLTDLVEGDVVGIEVLGLTLCYEVFDTITVEPDEAYDYIGIEEGSDLLTLMTCVPYGVNTHRLLVRCVRCEVPDWWDEESDISVAEATAASGRIWPFLIAVAALLVLLVVMLVRRHRRKGGNDTGGGGAGGDGYTPRHMAASSP